MKMIALLAAATVAVFAIPASASAAPMSAPAGTPMVTHSASVIAVDQRHHNRRASWRRTCTTKWRHHRRVRVCRKVRYWR
jgi:hypothetical protein